MAVDSYHPRILIPKYGQTANVTPLTTKRSQWKYRDRPHNRLHRETNKLFGKKTLRRDFFFRIPHNTLCLLPKYLRKLLPSNTLGNMQCFQEHLNTKVNAKIVDGGANRVYHGDSKIENTKQRQCPTPLLSQY